jgi:uncharacterized protein YgiM (DUF1202 family)
MKRMIFAALLCLAAAALFAQKAGDRLYVNVDSASLKASAGFFGASTETVKYGDEIRVTAVNGKWVEVQKSGGKAGWIESSKLTSKRISNQGNTANASAKEIALAGKGFSPEIEEEYKKGGGKLNYPAVDDMEKASIAESDLFAFIEEGHLAKGE